jgi:hypothetical protein
MHMIAQQVTLFDPALSLLGQSAEYLCQMLSQLLAQRLAPTLR